MAIQNKWHGVPCDNTHLQKAARCRALLEHYNWELFDHPPHNFDLSDHPLITYLKNWL
jgi:hypothetical protein